MSVVLINCGHIIFGIPEQILPMVAPFTFERVRYRFRHHSFPMAYFKTKSGIRQFPIEQDGDHWTVSLDMEQGRNERP